MMMFHNSHLFGYLIAKKRFDIVTEWMCWSCDVIGFTRGTLDTLEGAGGGVEARGTVNTTGLLRVRLPARATLYTTHREHGYHTNTSIPREVIRCPMWPTGRPGYLLRVSRWAHRACGAGQTVNDPFWGMLSSGAGREGTVVWVTREAGRTRPAVRSVLGADQAGGTWLWWHTAGVHGL